MAPQDEAQGGDFGARFVYRCRAKTEDMMPDHPHSHGHAHPQHLQGVALPPKSGKTKSLVVLLHGVGADGNDLLGLAPYWAPALPDTEFVSPHAPFPFDMAPSGRQWFSLQDRTPATVLAGIQTAAPILDHFLDELLAARDLDESHLALVGFSQGTMMSLYCGLRRTKPLACIVGYSGALAGASLLTKEIRSRPPVLLVHGEEDPVVPFTSLNTAVKALTAAGVKVEALERPGLGHSIDEDGLKRGGEFLTAALTRQ